MNFYGLLGFSSIGYSVYISASEQLPTVLMDIINTFLYAQELALLYVKHNIEQDWEMLIKLRYPIVYRDYVLTKQMPLYTSMYCKGMLDSRRYPELYGDPTPEEPEIVCLLLLCGMHTQHPGVGDVLYHVRDSFNYVLGCKLTNYSADPIPQFTVSRLIEQHVYDGLLYLICHGFRVEALYRHTLTSPNASRLVAYVEQYMPDILKDRTERIWGLNY